MFVKKSILAVVTVAALGASAAAVASAPVSESFFNGSNSGFVVGIQGGYADEHWDNLFSPSSPTSDVKDTGFAARGYVGYDFNKYLGVESGFTYLPKTTVSGLDGDIKNYAIDLLAKLTVPVTNVFSVYAKAGASYLNSKVSISELGSATTNTHIGPAFGVGAAYEVVPNLAIDLSWMRFSGEGHSADSRGNFDFQPNPDVVLLGVSYKFPVRYT